MLFNYLRRLKNSTNDLIYMDFPKKIKPFGMTPSTSSHRTTSWAPLDFFFVLHFLLYYYNEIQVYRFLAAADLKSDLFDLIWMSCPFLGFRHSLYIFFFVLSCFGF